MENEERIERVQRTWGLASGDPDAAAALFYGHLFEVAPEVKPMFKSDMTEQGRKLMSTISLVVSSLDDLEKVLPAVKQLGVKHVELGVERDHYPIVGSALIWTLSTALGDDFDDADQTAWAETYGVLADVMTSV